MNYRHAYHAGNFADVMKHTALVSVLEHLRKKDAAFAVVDTHAGRGIYDLAEIEAKKTGEASEGIGRLGSYGDMPIAVAPYWKIVSTFGGGKYPGSPLIGARLLRKQDRLIAIERHDDEFLALRAALSPYVRARAVLGDGYRELKRLLPPPERRGLILIDPPYEADDEFSQLGAAFDEAYRRFATGIYLIWLPLKQRHDADALAGELLNAGVGRLLLSTLDVGRKPEAPPQRLSACGLFVANPPFGFAGEMQAALAHYATQLAQGEGAACTVEWLAGSE